MDVINALAPVLLLVAIGSILRTRGFLSQDVFTGLNKLAFWYGLPALLFVKIATTPFDPGPALRIVIVLIVTMCVMIGVSYVLARLLRLSRQSVGTFVQAGFRCNTAFVGLPVVSYALPGAGGDELLRLAVLASAPTIPFLNIVAVMLLMGSSRDVNGDTSRLAALPSMLWRSLTNPLVLSCIVALPFALSDDLELPVLVVRSCDALGSMALPLALLSIGSSLSWERMLGNWRLGGLVSILNIGLLPLLGAGLIAWMGMAGGEALVALVFLASPVATSSYIMVQQLGGDEALAGSSIVISHILAVIPLSIVLAVYAV
jgi:malate permease and related proteins